ncbi:hypothetical protein [Mycolicibacterium moriokaense]|uniref:Uncharacterized protein n=1 Tax=Mycolicibacterium moriokaense TaxID=39691 RepID=A0A318HBK6_9MYCO|nr:hypothetical protein [Mycolicibacterium moriokaense]PXW96471.1 hypothetical protein C8E89_1522 [Mycolicibacterium moriokaense]
MALTREPMAARVIRTAHLSALSALSRNPFGSERYAAAHRHGSPIVVLQTGLNGVNELARKFVARRSDA